jgi:hypothetical protein
MTYSTLLVINDSISAITAEQRPEGLELGLESLDAQPYRTLPQPRCFPPLFNISFLTSLSFFLPRPYFFFSLCSKLLMQQYVYLLHEGTNGLTRSMHGAVTNSTYYVCETPLRRPLSLRNSRPQSLVTAAEPCPSWRSEQGPQRLFCKRSLNQPFQRLLHPLTILQAFEIELYFLESPALEPVAVWSRGCYSKSKKRVFKNE